MSTTRRSFFGAVLGGFAAAMGWLKAKPMMTPAQELQKFVVTAVNRPGWGGVMGLKKGDVITIGGRFVVNPNPMPIRLR